MQDHFFLGGGVSLLLGEKHGIDKTAVMFEMIGTKTNWSKRSKKQFP